LRAVARVLGQPPQRLVRYVASTGGRRPVARMRGERCLSAAEREEISRGLAGGLFSRQIAAAIARSHSTVSREVARNGGRDGYRAAVADAACGERARRPKAAKLAGNAALRAVVEQRLEEKWSPQQIRRLAGSHLP